MNEKILIVDDQAGIRMLLKEVLQKEGYDIYQASNGHQALTICKQISPNLVLLDMKIPGMDGLTILAKMKEQNKDIKVIIMTAYEDRNMIEQSQQLGAMAHFPKPFDIDELKQVVKKYIGKNLEIG